MKFLFPILFLNLIGLQAQQLEFYIETTSAIHNDTVKTTLKTNGFQHIVSTQFSLNWNPAQLQYLNSHSFFPSNLPLIGDTRTEEGLLLVSWIHPQANGQILQDSSSLLELHFLVKACPGELLDISLSNEPLQIEVVAISNEQYNSLIPEMSYPDWSTEQESDFLGADTLLCRGETLTLHIPNCTNCQILWNTGSNSDNLEINKPDTFSVSITTESGCTLRDSLIVQVADAPEVLISAYSLITPNGDLINDQLCFEHIEKFEPNKLVIFNRRGQVVFQQLNYQNDWSGTYNGKPLSEGDYYYILSFGNNFLPIKSTLTILR